MADTPIWERLSTDTDKSYQAFCIYRDMGVKRSLDKAHAKYKGVTEEERKRNGLVADGTFRDWSTKHTWQERVSAFDTYQAQERTKRKLHEQLRLEDNVLRDYQNMRRAIDKRIKLLKDVDYKSDMSDLHSLLSLMKQADDYARRAVGLPDKITEQKNEHTGKDGKPIETTATIIIKTGMSLDDL